MYTTAALSLLDNLSNALKKAFTPNKQAQEDAKKGIEDIANAEKELYKQRAANSISFEDFQTKIAELAKQEAEFKEKLAGMGFSLGDAFATAFKEALGSVGEGMTQMAEKMQAQSLGLYQVVDTSDKEATAKKQARFDKFGVAVTATAEDIAAKRLTIAAADLEAYDTITKDITALEDKKSKAAEEAASTAHDAYYAMAIGIGASFAQMAAEGKHNIGEFVLFALDGLMKLVPVIVAEIFGQALGQLGPIGGAIASAGITAAFMGLVGVAKSAVLAGYKLGGYTGDIPEDAPAGVVHGKEFVHTAEVTRTNRNLFQFLHKGGTLPEYVRKAGLDMPQMQTVDVMEMTKRFERQVIEFQAKRKEIDNRVAEITRTMPIVGRGGNDDLLKELKEMRKELTAVKTAVYDSSATYKAHTAVEMHVTSDTAVLDVEMKRAAIRNIMRGG